jgi:16S rRNA (adenine1518-N6/adenine1519-N6)-dimethyltransferase
VKQVKAKKHLGQHFLNDNGIAEDIVDALSYEGYKGVLEIGPGMGVLTQFLVKKVDIDFKTIDLDEESIVYLKEHYPFIQDNIISGDFLKIETNKLFEDKYAIIGNFPYNISSQILFKVYENKELIPEVVGMFQKEVAERIASKPGRKAYGILSVLLQAFYDIEYLFTVQEHSFNPPPRVKSAVIRLRRNNTIELDCDHADFKRVIKTAFNQRRKTMRNSLKSMGIEEIKDHEIFSLRPEQLSVEQFVQLTNMVVPKA